jgi:catechol 2,3-dioxygenase-like lactoylglutathione lyase family enzyme
MQLNHINLCVPDVRETSKFFEQFLDFTLIDEKGDGIIAILKNDASFLLVLSKLAANDTAYPRDFHIGFMQTNQQQVTDIYNKLKSSGLLLEREPKKIRDTFGFYFTAPGGIMIEIASPLGT